MRDSDSSPEEMELAERNRVLGLALGIVAGVLALASLALPWWTLEVEGLGTISLYPWGARGGWVAMGSYGLGVYLALLFAFVGGVVSIVGGFKGNRKRNMLLGGIILTAGVIIFALSVQLWIQKTFIYVDSLFYSGTYDGYAYTAHASLTTGFWMALAAAVLSLTAYVAHPKSIEKVHAEEEHEAVKEEYEIPAGVLVTCPECGTKNTRTESQCRKCDRDLTDVKRSMAMKLAGK
jgi:heme exporter protein D/ribosomal protein L40E